MEQTEGSHPVYSIGAVARMLDVATSTLRSWEERYELIVPDRSPGGQRVYSRDQVEQLRFVGDRIANGLQAAEAHRLLAEQLDSGGPLDLSDPEERSQMLVLLAERDPYAAELSEYFLRTEGYDVAVAVGSDEATSTYEREHPDLVIIELMLAGGRGIDLCQRLADRGVTVLATSALDLREEALTAGAEAFLLKPFAPLQLVSAVRDLLGTSALTRPRLQTASR